MSCRVVYSVFIMYVVVYIIYTIIVNISNQVALYIIIRFIHPAMKEYVKTARLHNRKKKEKNKESDPTEGRMMHGIFV